MLYDFEEMIERIKKIKKEKGLTNKQLSELADVPYGTLNKILGSETKEPSINAIIKISIALGVSADYIINGTKEKSSPPELDGERDKIVALLQTLKDSELEELENFVDFLLYKRGR